MAKIVLFVGIVGTFILTGYCWASLTHETYIGDVGTKITGHPCPVLPVRFIGMTLPKDLTECPCDVQAVDREPFTMIHPPAALVEAARPTDEVRISWHDYTPPIGGERKTAVHWELVRGGVRTAFPETPAKPVYTSLLMLGLAPGAIGIVLSFILSLVIKRQEG